MSKKRLSTLLAGLTLLAAGAAATNVHIGKYDAESRMILAEYTLAADGYYHLTTNKEVNAIDGEPYAFNPKKNILYIKNDKGNYYVVLNKNVAKLWKKSDVPQVDEREAAILQSQVTQQLYNHYDALNKSAEARRKQMAQAKAEEDSRNAAIRRQKEQQQRREELRQTAKEKKMSVPAGGLSFKCELCNHTEMNVDRLQNVYAVKDGRIYQILMQTMPLNLNVEGIHIYKLRDDLAGFDDFKRFRQSEECFDGEFTKWPTNVADAKSFNTKAKEEYWREINSKVPYGYITVRDAGDTFTFTYYNTSLNKSVRSIRLRVDDYGSGMSKEYTLIDRIEPRESMEYSLEYGPRRPSDIQDAEFDMTITYTDGTTISLPEEEIIQL